MELMITATITNIVLEGNRFRVYISLSNGIQEDNLFIPESTAGDALNRINERKVYYEDLKQKEQELQNSLVGMEI